MTVFGIFVLLFAFVCFPYFILNTVVRNVSRSKFSFSIIFNLFAVCLCFCFFPAATFLFSAAYFFLLPFVLERQVTDASIKKHSNLQLLLP